MTGAKVSDTYLTPETYDGARWRTKIPRRSPPGPWPTLPPYPPAGQAGRDDAPDRRLGQRYALLIAAALLTGLAVWLASSVR
jgi:hypothetical protein